MAAEVPQEESGSSAHRREGKAKQLTDATHHTLIDWLKSDHDRTQHRREGRRSSSGRRRSDDGGDKIFVVMGGVVSYAFDALQPWLAAVIVGALCGVLASSIEVVTHWLTDLKLGFCHVNGWASRYLCCLRDPRMGNDGSGGDAAGGGCAAFVFWADWLESSTWSALWLEMGVYVAFSTLFAVLASWLCREYAPCAAGSGIIEIKTILSGIRMQEYLTPRVLFIKSVALCASVGSGLSLGKEGPFVHMSCCVGSIIGSWFPKYRRDEGASRELMSAAAAAGVSVAFGSPIGGVLFSLEEVSYFFPHRTMIQALLAAVVSTLVMKGMDATHTGRAVLFSINYRHQFHWFEVPVFALIGVIGGIVGATICKWNSWWTHIKARASLRSHPVREVFFVAVITAVLNFIIPVLRGGMLGTLVDLFDDCSHGNENSFLCVEDETSIVMQLLVAVVLRVLMMVVTVNCALPAGCFVPSLFIGACLGRAVGIWTRATVVHNYRTSEVLQSSCPDAASCIIPGVYAVVGAAAVLAGVTRMTMSLVVIMFEITGGLEYIVPCMLVVITSRWVCDVLGVASIYDIHLDFKEYPYLSNKAELSWEISVLQFLRFRTKQRRRMQQQHERARPLSPRSGASDDTVQRSVVVLWDGMSVKEVEGLLERYPFSWFPVISSLTTYLFVGSVSRNDVERMVGQEHSMGDESCSNGVQVFFTSSMASAAARTSFAPIPSAGERRGDATLQRLAIVRDWSHVVYHCSVQSTLEMTVNKLLVVFRALGNQHVVVVDGGRLVDIITRGDMITFLRAVRVNEGARGSLKRWIRRAEGH